MRINKSVLPFIVFTSLIIGVFAGCDRSGTNNELVNIDSLLSQKQFETALKKIKTINPNNLGNKDKAYYSLLKTQADYKNYIVATTDSAINFAVNYYEHSTDKEKYTRSLIYQGCVNEELGNLEKAVECYHKADDTADNNDLQNKAFAKMRLGLLYQNQVIGATTIAINKLKEAYNIYSNLEDSHYSLVCLSEIARIYCSDKEKSDSALLYVNKAIDLAKTQREERYTLFDNLYKKALYLSNIKHDYERSKNTALEAISLDDVIDHPRVHFCLAKCYAQLGNIDSAIIIINQAPKITSDIDSISYYDLMSHMEKAQGNIKGFEYYFDKSDSMNDSIMISSLNCRLREVEKKYDTQKVELENAKLSSKLKTSLLSVAAIAIISLILLLFTIRYRQRLKMKEMENELINADLASSLDDLSKMQKAIESYDEELIKAKQEYVNAITSSESQVSELKSEIEDANKSIASGYQERERLNEQIHVLEEKEKRSNEMKEVIKEQITVVRELLNSSYERDSETFTKTFNSSMTLSGRSDKGSSSYWKNFYTITNEIFDDILIKAQEIAGGILKDDDLFIIALCCWKFPRQGIMICMRYKNLASVTNKKVKVAKKLKMKNMEEFLTLYRDNKESE